MVLKWEKMREIEPWHCTLKRWNKVNTLTVSSNTRLFPYLKVWVDRVLKMLHYQLLDQEGCKWSANVKSKISKRKYSYKERIQLPPCKLNDILVRNNLGNKQLGNIHTCLLAFLIKKFTRKETSLNLGLSCTFSHFEKSLFVKESYINFNILERFKCPLRIFHSNV